MSVHALIVCGGRVRDTGAARVKRLRQSRQEAKLGEDTASQKKQQHIITDCQEQDSRQKDKRYKC